jgi:hypothetical protein
VKTISFKVETLRVRESRPFFKNLNKGYGMDKNVEDYEIIVHGVMNSQYFQGCGISYTSYTDVSTGIGSSKYEACEDALEQLAQNNWNVEGIKNNLSEKIIVPEDSEDVWCYVSIRVK